MQFFSIDGVVIHSADSGPADAPALVFANSLGSDFRIWEDIAARFGARFRIIRYDKRGHGLSDAPAAPYRIDDHVSDLAGLLDTMGVKEAIVVGLSVGGMIAQGLSARRPELVRGLVLCDTGHKIGTAELWNGRIDAIEAGGIEAIADGVLERWFSAQFRAERPVELAGWRNMLTRTTAAGYSGTCAAIRDADLTAAARGIAVPTLCVVGDQDGATPPDLVRELAGLIPDAGFEIIEAAGHLPCIDQPDALGRLIEDFIRERQLA